MVNKFSIYNTATRKKEVLTDHKVGIYVCGITPYDTTHIGHAFTFITYDVLIRYLRFLGRKVTYVQNVTDIDDDILIRAKATGQNWRSLGDRETRKYLTDMKDLNMIAPDYYVRATDHIKEVIIIIKRLIDDGYAYVRKGSVYFSVKKDPEFGQRLGKLNYEVMLDIANERGNFPLDPDKNDPLDFVLWQSHKKNEPFWNSPWGKGRPGWHIECSAMSTKYLGQPFAIHGGGADLKFSHHEAEMSQSERAYHKKLAKIWMHTAMVYCDGKKMSKSLGNMIFIRDLLKKYSADIIRWYLLSHHYRQEWEYQEKEFIRASNEIEKLRKQLDAGKTFEKAGSVEFIDELDDDLNIPAILKRLPKLTKKNPRMARIIAEVILGLKFS